MPDLAWLGLIALVVLGVGLAVGMLAAPAVTRWTDRDEESVERD